MDIKGLLDVTCKTVANMIKGKTPEEIRKTFNIKNDFTEEEEAQVSHGSHSVKTFYSHFHTEVLYGSSFSACTADQSTASSIYIFSTEQKKYSRQFVDLSLQGYHRYRKKSCEIWNRSLPFRH